MNNIDDKNKLNTVSSEINSKKKANSKKDYILDESILFSLHTPLPKQKHIDKAWWKKNN